MTFDKICRGSVIGEAHNQGMFVAPESNSAKRGTHVSNRSYKLETTQPAERGGIQRQTTQTFKTQDWFRHDNRQDDTSSFSKDCFSPRYWRQANGRAPAPAAAGTQFMCRDKDGSLRSAETDLDRRKEEPAVKRRATAAAVPTETEGTKNPTFRNSVDWMAFSSPREHYRWADSSTSKEQTRHEYLKKKQATTTLHGGNEENNGQLTNAVDNIPSKGKKSFSSTGHDAKKLLRQDPTVLAEKRSERKHAFQKDSAPQNTAAVAPHGTRPGHRSSQEVHEALNWRGKTEDHSPSRVVIGGKTLRNIDCAGRRHAQECAGHAENNTEAAAAGASPRGRVRDHRNSDSLRQHIAPNAEAPKYIKAGNVPTAMSSSLPVQNRIYAYPTGSTIPSGLPKTFSYGQSQGLQPCQNRAIGLFSPFNPMVQFNPPARLSIASSTK